MAQTNRTPEQVIADVFVDQWGESVAYAASDPVVVRIVEHLRDEGYITDRRSPDAALHP